MNISLKNNDAVSGIVKLEIGKADYAEKVDKGLRNFRQKANVPGFRKGMIPMGMVKKMYGKHLLVEEVNKLISENLYGYIRENKLNILGEPMPNLTEQKEIDFEKQEEFEFCFDVAFAPEIKIELSKNDKVPYYQVAIDDEMLNKQVASYRANFSSYDKVEEVKETDLVKGTIAELENGSPKEGGIVVEDAVLMPSYLKEGSEKAKFIGAKVNTVVVFNPNEAYEGEGAESEIASLLKIEKETVAALTNDFSFEIKEIIRREDAEMNQELFDKVFGENAVSSEEEFKNKIKETLLEQFKPQSDFKFLVDARDLLVQRVGKLNFADDLLKRWLAAANETNTQETIDNDYPKIIEDITYHMIKDNIVKENGLTIKDSDIEDFARRVTKAQFAQYGMLSISEDILDNYSKEMLNNKQTLDNIVDRAIEEKLAVWLKDQVELEVKELSTEEFGKLFK